MLTEVVQERLSRPMLIGVVGASGRRNRGSGPVADRTPRSSFSSRGDQSYDRGGMMARVTIADSSEVHNAFRKRTRKHCFELLVRMIRCLRLCRVDGGPFRSPVLKWHDDGNL